MPFEEYPFSNNSADGPAANTAIGGAGALVPWQHVANGAAGTTISVTPKVTGRFKVTAMVGVANATGAAIIAQLQLQVNGADVNGAVSVDVIEATTGFGTLSMTFVTTLPVSSTPATFGILVTGNGASITANESCMVVEELDLAA